MQDTPKIPFFLKLRIGFGFMKRRVMRKFRNPLEMPKSFIPGMIPTLNDTGFMTETMDEYSKAFVDYAATCKNPVLDIGCAYGVATLPALANGATVVACDMEKAHVDILARRTPDEDKARLTIDTGILPHKDFPPESFDAILAARVLHFLRPHEMEESVAKMKTWLKPGGKAFLITDTMYTGFWMQHIPIYEQKKAAGDPWPGEIENANRYLPSPARDTTTMTYMHLLDPEVITRLCENAGFEIDRVGFVQPNAEDQGKAYGGLDMEKMGLSKGPEKWQSQSDRERVGIIVTKPA